MTKRGYHFTEQCVGIRMTARSLFCATTLLILKKIMSWEFKMLCLTYQDVAVSLHITVFIQV